VVHDRELLERLTALSSVSFDGEVFRATRRGLNALAPSVSGGRWMVPNQAPTLYTSTERDGALAEIAYHWSQLVPRPSKPVLVHRLRLGTKKTLRLGRADLVDLGVEWNRYEQTNYRETQTIGAAIAYLEYDGLIAPSARWPCDNVMVFLGNSEGDEEAARLLESREVDWLEWAEAHERLPSP
jgi:RES domain